MARDPADGTTSDLFGATISLRETIPVVPVVSPIKKRLIEARAVIATEPSDDIGYQHTVLCQTSMPYKRPANDLREWERRNGLTFLRIEAGVALNPQTEEFVKLPLPFGAKARLVLIHLNSEAVRTRSPVVEVEDSLTAFLRRLIDRDPHGPDIRRFKDQLAALSAATIRLAVKSDTRAIQVNTQIVEAFDLWFPRDGRQRLLWPSTVQLSQRYFDSLANHAVPLDMRAVSALGHSALALDLYAWLAQRLHRVPKDKPAFLTWPLLHEQFGQGFARLRDFRKTFLDTLRQVHAAYPDAQIEEVVGMDGMPQGIRLTNSRPPVLKQGVVVKSLGDP